MAKYNFDIRDGSRHFVDDVGTELPDLKSAHREALNTIVGLAGDGISLAGAPYFASVLVRDGSQVVIKMHLAFDCTVLAAAPSVLL